MEENRSESYWRKSFSLCVFFLSAAWSLQYGSREAREYGRKYANICVQNNADADKSLRLIGRHYLARYREVDGGVSRSDRDYIRTWPWKIVCHKFTGQIPRLQSVAGYIRINQGRWAACGEKIQSNKQMCHRTNVRNEWFVDGFTSICRYLTRTLWYY